MKTYHCVMRTVQKYFAMSFGKPGSIDVPVQAAQLPTTSVLC